MKILKIIGKILIVVFVIIGVLSTAFWQMGGNPIPFFDPGGMPVLATTSVKSQQAVIEILSKKGSNFKPFLQLNTDQVQRVFLRNDTIVNYTTSKFADKIGNAGSGVQIVVGDPLGVATADALTLQSNGFESNVVQDPEGREDVVFLISDAFADGKWVLVYRKPKYAMSQTPEFYQP